MKNTIKSKLSDVEIKRIVSKMEFSSSDESGDIHSFKKYTVFVSYISGEPFVETIHWSNSATDQEFYCYVEKFKSEILS